MRITGSLTVTLILFTSSSLAAGPEQPFHILAPEEIARHQQALEQLQGEEFERYRNEVYGDLVQRAQAHGYRMPATPPWQQQAQRPALPPSAPATLAPGNPGAAAEPARQVDVSAPPADMPKLVAQQKRVIEEAVQQELAERSQASAAAEATADKPAQAANAATDSYREKMRRRFDDFMARRESRQHQPAAGMMAPPASPDTAAPAPMQPAPPAVAQPPAYPRPPIPPQMMPPRFPVPAYPQPAYPAPGYAPQPYYSPQPANPQGSMPGAPPYAYPPRAPGWY